MNKSELVRTLADQYQLQAEEAAMVVNVFFDSIRSALVEGGRVEIRGLGSFKVKHYPGYIGRNPKTGVSVQVAEKRLPVFRLGKELKNLLNPE